MNRIKINKLFGFLSVTSVLSISPILLVVSCKNNNKFVSTDIGGLNNYFNPGLKQNDNLINEVKRIKNGNDEQAKEKLNQKTILISTGGRVNDQSFNQSVWEALSKFSKEIENNENSYFETYVIDQATQNEAYDYAIKKGYDNWILTGFQQESLLGEWLKIGKNKERFEQAKIRVITVDWYSDKLPIQPGRILGLNFRTQEGGFAVGYAISRLLSEINQENPELYKSNETYLNSFGGGDFSGVTNFNYGYNEGMRQFNEDSKTSDRFNKYKILATDIDLTTGFAPTTDARTKVNSAVDGAKGKQPQVILPVAGSLTANAIDRVKEKKQGQWVIGVDTDQSLAFSNDKSILITSIEKRISIAIYKALVTIYGLSGYENANMDSFLGTNRINNDGFIVNNQGALANYNVNGGYIDGFVGASKSTLDSSLKFKNGKTFAERFDEIVSETWNEFFIDKKDEQGNGVGLGRFNIPISDTKNQGLKPTEQTIEKFNKYIGENFKDLSNEQKTEAINAILGIKNVLFGYMTAGNLESYFKPVIKEINN